MNYSRKKIYQSALIGFLIAVAILIANGIKVQAQNTQCTSDQVRAFDPAAPIVTPLSTVGAKIVDRECKEVVLRGVAWFGIESISHAPEGLFQRDYKEILKEMRDYGFNFIRLPFSVNALRSDIVYGINYQLGSNAELQDKKPIEIMDLIIQEAKNNGLMVLLDAHRLNDFDIPPLWYNDQFSEQDWINTWRTLAERYKNQSNVIGADLLNEPHVEFPSLQGATWGSGDESRDWNLAAERAGNAVQAIAPEWLIVVEGIGFNPAGQQLTAHWWGGNLERVRDFPVRLNIPNKIVYSPHEYGPYVYNQLWFYADDFPNNLDERWQIGFMYIVRENIAPILVGEFNIVRPGENQQELTWFNKLIDLIKNNNLSYAYWAWANNDLVKSDWRTPDETRQQLLSPVLPGAPLAN